MAALPAWSRLPSPAHDAALHAVADACAAVDPGTRLHVAGSVRLGVAGPSTDLDLVWATAVPGALDRLAALLDGFADGGGAGDDGAAARGSPAASSPSCAATVGGIGVDVQRVRVDPGDPALDPAALDDADLRAVLAVRDADALPAADPAFRALLGEVRAWSRAGSSTAPRGGSSAGSAGRCSSRRPARTTSPTWPGSCGTAPGTPAARAAASGTRTGPCTPRRRPASTRPAR